VLVVLHSTRKPRHVHLVISRGAVASRIYLTKLLFRIAPYSACLIAGLVLYVIGTKLAENLKALVLNIAAAFVAIPFLYLIYEQTQKASQKKLNKELFDYAKMQTDREILSVINQLAKIVYPYEAQDFSYHGISSFLSTEKDRFRDVLEKSEYLGFQVFKNWSISQKNMNAILQNPFILQRLDNEQSISLVMLLKEISAFEAVLKQVTDLYLVTDVEAEGYVVKAGKEISERNSDYPDRYLLLRHLKDDNYLVADFGDFAPYQFQNLLKICKVNRKYLEDYAYSIYEMVLQINQWVKSTGNEFLLDTNMFRMASKSNSGRGDDTQQQRAPDRRETAPASR
jgi:hypothetical protein